MIVWVAWSKGLCKSDLLLAGCKRDKIYGVNSHCHRSRTSTSCQSSWPDGRRDGATMNNTLFSCGQKAERLQCFSITRDIFRNKASIPKTPGTWGNVGLWLKWTAFQQQTSVSTHFHIVITTIRRHWWEKSGNIHVSLLFNQSVSVDNRVYYLQNLDISLRK